MICKKMQHHIAIFKMQNRQYLPKKRAHDQQKNMINKTLQNIGKKMQYCLCIMPFLEVTILFNQHFTIVGNTVGESPTGILSLFI